MKVIKQQIWDLALDSFGYQYIFSCKVKKLEFWAKVSRIAGFVLPVLVGGVALTYLGSNPEVVSLAVIIVTPLLIIQLIVSATLTVNSADKNQSIYARKAAELLYINSDINRIAKDSNLEDTELERQYELLNTRYIGIIQDKTEISEIEKRKGMRWALREYRRNCAGCNVIPTDMKSTECGVCGKL